MISFFRRLFGTKIGAILALAFVALIAVAFALGDVTGNFGSGGVGGGNIARVGNQNIPVSELDNAIRNRLRTEQRNNPTLDMGRFVESGGLDQTLAQIINRYALAVFGEKYGLGVSKRLVDSEISEIPQAKGLDGKYDSEAFEAFLRGIGLTEKMVRADLSQNLYARQILSTTVKGTIIPNSLVLPYASLLLEKRTGRLAAIPSTAFLPKQPPSDAVLAKYYKDNAIKFTVPERRAISYAIFDKDIIAEKAKPSAADIAAHYKKNAATYAASESRNIAQVIVPTQAAAKTLAGKIAGGQSISAAASSIGLSITNTANTTKASLTRSASKSVADAVFGAKQGSVATPARGGLGWYVVKVTGVTAIPAKSLAQASSAIAVELEKSNSEEMLAELTTEIEDEFSGGATIGDIAKAQGLKVETTPKLLGNGVNPEDRNYRPIAEMQRILPAAFQIEPDGDAQLIEIEPGTKFAMVAVADLDEAAPPPLAEVKQLIVRSWALSEGSKRAKTAAEKVRKAVAAGQPLGAALAALKVKLPAATTVSGTRRDLNKDGQPLSPPLALLFSMKKGTAKTLAAPGDNGWFIVVATEIIRGDASGQKEMLAARKAEMRNILTQEYQSQFVQAAMSDIGVERNEDALTLLRARLTQSGDGQ
ncbi:MAG: SurA N-terminal domain-containing protein [Sphingorhabdus sp.]